MEYKLCESDSGMLYHVWHDGQQEMAADITMLSDLRHGLWQDLASGGWVPSGDEWEIIPYSTIAENVAIVAVWDGTLAIGDPGRNARLALGEECSVEIYERLKPTLRAWASGRGRPTREDIAADWELWLEYVDPEGVMAHDKWTAMTVAERVALQAKVYGDVR